MNADDNSGAALLNACDRAWQLVAQAADTFEREVAGIPLSDAEKLLADPQLLEYANHLQKIRDNALLLPPAQTAALTERLNSTGAWEALARQLLARISVADGDRQLSLGEAVPTLYHPDEARRRDMCEAISAGLADEADLRATALVMLTRARHVYLSACEIDDWLSPTYAANQVTAAEVRSLLEVVRDHNCVVHDYYKAKAGFMGSGQLTDADRYAPIVADLPIVTWQEACDIVVTAFGRLGPTIEKLARDLLNEDAVDALPRPGKRRGSLTFTLPGGGALILLNFTQTPRDVMTLGHELGHAVHGRLTKTRGVLGAAVPTVLAETVGLFTELLTAEVYADSIRDPSHRRALQARWVEDQLTAVFRQTALHDFEAALYAAAAEGSQLGTEALGDMWLAQQAALYGPAIFLEPGYKLWWSYLDNFYFDPGSRYAYAYGQLAASGLLAQYRESPGLWCRRFSEALQAGGTRRPAAWLASLGLKPTRETGWLAAMQTLAEQSRAVYGDTSGASSYRTSGACHSGQPSGDPQSKGGDRT
ncbi:MAG TPA: M3 family metallopeptidase [Streptosporangiaceae bacterium]|nr:M3 family metallopeptidase [Streptosporangiaceae bacterium]